MKRIATLLTVHNRKDKTLNCLRELYKQRLPEGYTLEVFLTDDGCTDGTPEAIRKDFPEVNIIPGDGNLFWNRGMYAAWSEAEKTSPDFYLWLNDDTFLLEDCIICLIESSEKCSHKSVIVGATCSIGNPEEITYGGSLRGIGMLKPNGKLQEANLLNGNILLVPRHVYDIVGKNDPYFLHAIGDSDYGFRVIEKGLKNYVAPKILGECDEHEQLATWCNPDAPLPKRWNAMRKPTGIQPEQYFVYEYRHFGLLTAMMHYLTIHVRCLFPQIWQLKKHKF